MKAEFRHPMTKAQRVMGLIYLPLHSVGLPLLIALLYPSFFSTVDEIYLDLGMYLLGLLFCLTALHSFLRSSFSDLCDRPGRFLSTLLLCALAYLAMSSLVSSLLMLILGADSLVNPNTDTVNQLLGENYNVTFATTVIMAPILEECLFRGALFGSIRRKNRPAAYLVTIVIFAVYHLWAYFIADYSSTLWLYLLQYIPATLALCFAYERSGTIWCPIVLHAAINCLAMLAARSL